MKDFRRALKYLKPYRLRIALAIGCVFMLAALWGGGLSLLVPTMRILLSEEGLHGWAYTSAAEDQLGAKLVMRELPPGTNVKLPAGASPTTTPASAPTAAPAEGPAATAPATAPALVPQTLYKVMDVVDTSAGGPSHAHLRKGDWLIGLRRDGQDQILRADKLAGQLAQTGPHKVTLLVYNPLHADHGVRQVPIRMEEPGLSTRALLWVAGRFAEPTDFMGRFPMLVWVLGIMLVINMLRGLFEFFQEYLVSTAIWRGIMDLRNENYDIVLRLPVTYFSEKGVNDSMSRFLQDINELARGLVTLFGKTLAEPAKAIAMFLLAISFSWQLTLAVCVAGPPCAYVIRRLGKTMHKASKRALESYSSILSVLEETLRGIRVVKAYTMEGSERKRFFRVNRVLLKQQYKMERIDAMTGPTIETVGLLVVSAAVGAAGYMVLSGRLHGFNFVGWLVALFGMFDPVRKLAKVSNKFHQADAAAKRIFELRDVPQEVSLHDAPMLPRHHESIVVDNVKYRYPGANVDALDGVSLTIRAGEMVAFVGPNGSGKTTLISLLPRLLDPYAGRISIDGRDISQVSLRSLRRQIGLVTQESVIFNASVSENIAYGLRRPDMRRVQDAARKAFVEEFAQAMPNGMNTVIGEHGSTLSGGQRQRIAIARAILRDPAILIFDEALSQIDPDSERKISQALNDFRKGRTTLVIAHRFNTILEADKIVVMDRGRIVDVGPHAELIQRCGLYKQLYDTQLTANVNG